MRSSRRRNLLQMNMLSIWRLSMPTAHQRPTRLARCSWAKSPTRLLRLLQQLLLANPLRLLS